MSPSFLICMVLSFQQFTHIMQQSEHLQENQEHEIIIEKSMYLSDFDRQYHCFGMNWKCLTIANGPSSSHKNPDSKSACMIIAELTRRKDKTRDKVVDEDIIGHGN